MAAAKSSDSACTHHRNLHKWLLFNTLFGPFHSAIAAASSSFGSFIFLDRVPLLLNGRIKNRVCFTQPSHLLVKQWPFCQMNWDAYKHRIDLANAPGTNNCIKPCQLRFYFKAHKYSLHQNYLGLLMAEKWKISMLESPLSLLFLTAWQLPVYSSVCPPAKHWASPSLPACSTCLSSYADYFYNPKWKFLPLAVCSPQTSWSNCFKPVLMKSFSVQTM